MAFTPFNSLWILPPPLLFFCQINSEFHPLKTGHISKQKPFARKYADFEHFWKSLIINGFHFSYILLTCQSYAFILQELCFELPTCGIWRPQMPQVSVSYATSDNLRWYKWQFRLWRMRKTKSKRLIFFNITILDWTENPTAFCHLFSSK